MNRDELSMERRVLRSEVRALREAIEKWTNEKIKTKKKRRDIKNAMFFHGISLFFLLCHHFVILSQKIEIGLSTEVGFISSSFTNIIMIALTPTTIGVLMSSYESLKITDKLLSLEDEYIKLTRLRYEQICDRIKTIDVVL